MSDNKIVAKKLASMVAIWVAPQLLAQVAANSWGMTKSTLSAWGHPAADIVSTSWAIVIIVSLIGLVMAISVEVTKTVERDKREFERNKALEAERHVRRAP